MRNLDQIIGDLSPVRRARVALRGRELVAAEMALRQMRKARDLTQGTMAARLDIDQAGVSKIESRGDMLLSTLRNYVEAMGGTLKITAQFHDGDAIELSSIGHSDNGSKSQELGEKPKTKRAEKPAASPIASAATQRR